MHRVCTWSPPLPVHVLLVREASTAFTALIQPSCDTVKTFFNSLSSLVTKANVQRHKNTVTESGKVQRI